MTAPVPPQGSAAPPQVMPALPPIPVPARLIRRVAVAEVGADGVACVRGRTMRMCVSGCVEVRS